MRVKNQKTTINNKVRAIEQIFEHDPLLQPLSNKFFNWNKKNLKNNHV